MQTEKQLQFAALTQKTRKQVYKVINIYGKNISQTDQEDLYQEIMYAAWKAFESFKGQSSAATWLTRIAQFKTVSYTRSFYIKLKAKTVSNILYEFIADAPYKEPMIPASVIETLSPAEKITLQLRIEGKAFDQISEILNEPAGRLRIRMHRIAKRLQERIKELDY